jgi:hypothetical protein
MFTYWQIDYKKNFSGMENWTIDNRSHELVLGANLIGLTWIRKNDLKRAALGETKY